MRKQIGKDERTWTDLAWTWLHNEVRPHQRVFMPAGGTPLPLYKRCCEEQTPLLKSLRMIQLDEIISGPLTNNFRQFLEKEMAPFVNQMEWITDVWQSGPGDQAADVAILGVGINGHVAFHEPFLPRHFTAGCVTLSPEIQGYLGLEKPTWGLTYGVQTFLRAKKILVLARGESKRVILKKAIQDKNLPISYILAHPDVTLITDFEL